MIALEGGPKHVRLGSPPNVFAPSQIIAKGSKCVTWVKETDAENLYIPKGVIGIVLSWFISPILSGVFAVLLFLLVRTVVLRAGTNAFKRWVFACPAQARSTDQ